MLNDPSWPELKNVITRLLITRSNWKYHNQWSTCSSEHCQMLMQIGEFTWSWNGRRWTTMGRRHKSRKKCAEIERKSQHAEAKNEEEKKKTIEWPSPRGTLPSGACSATPRRIDSISDRWTVGEGTQPKIESGRAEKMDQMGKCGRKNSSGGRSHHWPKQFRIRFLSWPNKNRHFLGIFRSWKSIDVHRFWDCFGAFH